MIVREYRPSADVDISLRRDRVENIMDSLQLDWVKQRGGVKIVDDEWIKTASGGIVAIIQDEAIR